MAGAPSICLKRGSVGSIAKSWDLKRAPNRGSARSALNRVPEERAPHDSDGYPPGQVPTLNCLHASVGELEG